MSDGESSTSDPPIFYPPLPSHLWDTASGYVATPTNSSRQSGDVSSNAPFGNDHQLIDLDYNHSNPSITGSTRQTNTMYATSTASELGSSHQPPVTSAVGQGLYSTHVPKGPRPSLSAVHSQHLALHSVHNTPPPPKPPVNTDHLPLNPPVSTDPLTLRVRYMEQLCGKFQSENQTLREDFGRQRKNFMDKMLQMEAERSLLSNTLDRYSKEIREISTQLLMKDEELINVSMAAKLSQAHSREAFDADRVKYEEELASLAQILNVQSQDQSAVYSHERELWMKERESLRAEIISLKQPHDDLRPPSKVVANTVKSGETTPTPQLDSPPPEEANLEYEMVKAAQDTHFLRSVVVPLEEEIDFLKVKLKETQERLAFYEMYHHANKPHPPTLIDTESSLPMITSTTGGSSSTESEKITQLQHQLHLERTSHHDLEMHVEALMAQKTVSHQEIICLTEELDTLKNSYEVEHIQHSDLKKTWELANQHFLESQKTLKQELQTVSQQLTRTGDSDPGEVISCGAEQMNSNFLTMPPSHRRSQSNQSTRLGEIVPPGSLQKQKSVSLPSIGQDIVGLTMKIEDTASLQQMLNVLEKENNKLQADLTRQKAVCNGYEKQLQRVQEQMVAEMDDKERDMDRLKAEMDKCKTGIMRERDSQKNLRRDMNQEIEQIKCKIDTHREYEKKVKQELRVQKDKFTELKHDTQTEIARLTEDRLDLRRQMESAMEEYDCLKVIQAQQMAEYQENMNLQQNACQEAELNLKSTMGQLTSVQGRLEATEKDLCAQLRLVRDQLIEETQQKEKLTIALTSQLENSMRENAGLQSLKADIEIERRAKQEVLVSKASIQEKSTAFIQDQQRQIALLHKEKEASEKQVTDLLRQLQSLKHQLNRTAETQKDFVELSQSLQMRLVEMEESKQ